MHGDMCCAAHVKRLICGNLFLLLGCRTDVTIARLYRLTSGTQREQTVDNRAPSCDIHGPFQCLPLVAWWWCCGAATRVIHNVVLRRPHKHSRSSLSVIRVSEVVCQ